MADLDYIPALAAFSDRLRAARGIPSFADRVKPLTAIERKAVTDKIEASFDRIKARWDAEYREFEAAYAAEHADDAPEPEKARGKRRPLKFRERDIRRAIAGHLKAGLSVQRTEIDASGRIVIVTGQPEATDLAPADRAVAASEWD